MTDRTPSDPMSRHVPGGNSEPVPTEAGENEVSVTERGFLELLNTDIKDLEIAASLRRLGNKKVMEWDFKTAMPAVHRFAYQEVDLLGWVKRVASYKVMHWDFRDALKPTDDPAPPLEIPGTMITEETPNQAGVAELTDRLKGFIQYVMVNLIDEPTRAHVRVQEIAPGVIRFRLVVSQKDQKILVGRNGETASALRNLLKATAAGEGMHALVEILTHEEELSKSLPRNGSI